MHTAIRSFVRSPHLRQLLGRFATYVGASPYLAPATLNVIAHIELTGGVWYPRGGIYTIALSLQRLACELGVEFRTNTHVDQIAVREKRAVGVIVNGNVIPARHVISNVDAATTYEKLLPALPGVQRRAQALTQAEPSVSGFILLLGVRGEHPQLAHHNLFFCADYAREFDDIFKRGLPPNDPTVYVAITSKRDSAHAPPGCENWFVLVNAPPLGVRGERLQYDWTQRAAEYRERVLATLARHGLDIRDKILVEKILTPLDIERMTGARRGALYGASSNTLFAAFRRPPNVVPEVRGLYLAGGSAHPGGGVPMVMLSGAAAARKILERES